MRRVIAALLLVLFTVVLEGCGFFMVSQQELPDKPIREKTESLLWEQGIIYFEQQEYEKAYSCLTLSIEKEEEGNAYAYALLGDMYNASYYVVRDEKQAFHYWQEAAERGADASYWVKLGSCYLNAKGVEADMPKALECFEQALEQGYDEANAEEIKEIVEELKIRIEEQKESQ